MWVHHQAKQPASRSCAHTRAQIRTRTFTSNYCGEAPPPYWNNGCGHTLENGRATENHLIRRLKSSYVSSSSEKDIRLDSARLRVSLQGNLHTIQTLSTRFEAIPRNHTNLEEPPMCPHKALSPVLPDPSALVGNFLIPLTKSVRPTDHGGEG